MKGLLPSLLLVLAAHGVQAQNAAPNETADTNASCNASFHLGCQTTSGSSVSSSGFAAPIGVIGASLPESAALAVLVLVAATLARRRRDAARDERRGDGESDDSRR